MNSLILGFSNTSAMLTLSAVEREPPREGGRPLIHIPHSAILPSVAPRFLILYSMFGVGRSTLSVFFVFRAPFFADGRSRRVRQGTDWPWRGDLILN